MRHFSFVAVSSAAPLLAACADAPTRPPEHAPRTGPHASLAVTAPLSFRQISGGADVSLEDHTCGVTTANVAHCWGDNSFGGQLGVGTTTGPERCYSSSACSTRPVRVHGGPAVVRVNAGAWHTCGFTTSFVAYCWGSNEAGQLGDGTTATRLTPVRVAGGLAFGAVGSNGVHTCGITTGSRAYCWGTNIDGELGDGTTSRRLRPVAVVSPRRARRAVVPGGGA